MKIWFLRAGVTHYLRWANLAHAVGVRIPRRHRALVATSFLLLPNLLVRNRSA